VARVVLGRSFFEAVVSLLHSPGLQADPGRLPLKHLDSFSKLISRQGTLLLRPGGSPLLADAERRDFGFGPLSAQLAGWLFTSGVPPQSSREKPRDQVFLVPLDCKATSTASSVVSIAPLLTSSARFLTHAVSKSEFASEGGRFFFADVVMRCVPP